MTRSISDISSPSRIVLLPVYTPSLARALLTPACTIGVRMLWCQPTRYHATSTAVSPNATYAAASVWNRYFASLAARGDDLNAPGWWSPAFLPTLEQHQVTSALDLGCGTGSDTLVLARAG